MASLQELTDAAASLSERLQYDERLHPDVANRYAAAAVAIREVLQGEAPRITSGYRDPADVRRLLRRYEAGDPGIIVKPARQSWHLPDPETGQSRAIDVDRNSPYYDAFVKVWREFGGRVGADFGDPVHFDVPGPRPPQPAY